MNAQRKIAHMIAGSLAHRRMLDRVWRAAAFDFLDACFNGAPPDAIKHFAAVFVEAGYRKRQYGSGA